MIRLSQATRFACGSALLHSASGRKVLQRRRPEPPSAPSYRAPTQLDRADFAGPSTLPLVVVFSSSTCNTCPVVWEAVEPLASDRLAVERIDVQDDPKRHERYKIDGVPTTLVVQPDGVVKASFFGPLGEGKLDEAVAALDT